MPLIRPDNTQPLPSMPQESSDQPSLSDAGNEVDPGSSSFSLDPWSLFWNGLLGTLGGNPSAIVNEAQHQVNVNRIEGILNGVGNGTTSPLDAQKEISNDPDLSRIISPEQAQYITNMIEQFNAQQSYDRSIQSIKDSALAQQEAAIATGINPSAYIQGQNAGFTAAKADVSHENVALSRFQQKASMARTALALTGMMAGAGIRGASYIAGRKAVSKLAGSAFSDSISSLGANSAPRRAGKFSARKWNNLLQELEY